MPLTTYRTILEKIAFSHSSAAIVFADFCRMAACTLAMQTREEEYLETIRPYSREQLGQFSEALALLIQEMENAPFTDCLGEYYLTIAAHSSKQARGEFFTPQVISQLMAKVTFDADGIIDRGIPITVNEPACGAGGMVLAVAELFAPKQVDLLRVTCQDINPVATDMTYINTTLWGIPSKVILGNSLSREVPQKVWKNIHWTRVGEDQRQQFIAMRDMVAGKASTPNKESKEFQNSLNEAAQFEQKEFDLDLGSMLQTERTR